MNFKHCIIPLLALVALIPAESAPLSPQAIVENYQAAVQDERNSLRGASMEIDIDASLPKLQKNGRLHALRRISSLGRITYEALRFEGDSTVKNNVIARYITAEAESQKSQTPDLSVIPANYKFKYKGQIQGGGRDVYIFQVSPRKKRVGLYKGEIWIDAGTFQRVREAGTFVKNPSIFLKKIEFVREYEIRDGISVPLAVKSVIETRLVGKAELRIDFSNVSFVGRSTPENVHRASLHSAGGQ